MRLLIRFLRIYTPFICTVMVLINGVLFSRGSIPEDFTFLGSAISGNSILVVAYFFVTSMRMCIWFKLNLLCMLLVQLCGIAYNYLDIDFAIYLNAIILLSALGIIFFLIFRIFYKVTGVICNRRY